jgi:amidophosphoribosyltransferase
MCGIIAMWCPPALVESYDISKEIFYGLKAIQHRGRSSYGVFTTGGRNSHIHKKAGMIESDFTSLDHTGNANAGLGHVRWVTSGGSSEKEVKHNAQPEYLMVPFVAAVHNGQIYNGRQVLNDVKGNPRSECDIQIPLWSAYDSLLGKALVNDKDLEITGRAIQKRCEGSYSVGLITIGKNQRPNVSVVADPYNIRPLVYGEKGDLKIFASETAVFDRIGADFKRVIKPAEMVNIVDGKMSSVDLGALGRAHCAIEFVYFSDPHSVWQGKEVYSTRYNAGKLLWDNAPVEADVICPVPNSGLGAAAGYSHASKIPLNFGIKKNGTKRTFILATKEEKQAELKHTINVTKSVVNGKDVCVLDDSTIKGTVITEVIYKARKAGAEKVHVRVASPPVIGPCYLGVDMAVTKELIALREDGSVKRLKEISDDIGADSIGYLSKENLQKAIDVPLCTGCFDFDLVKKKANGYPEALREEVLKLVEAEKLGERPYEFSCKVRKVDDRIKCL